MNAKHLKLTTSVAFAGLLILTAFVGSVNAAQVAPRSPPGANFAQSRLQFTHIPIMYSGAVDGDQLFWPLLEDQGIYLNDFSTYRDINDPQGLGIEFPDVAYASLRVYGQRDKETPDVYSSYGDAFDPNVIPKDSVTFNPAMITHTDPDFTVCSPDSTPQNAGANADADLEGDVPGAPINADPHDLECATFDEGDFTPGASTNAMTWIRSCGDDSNLKKHLRVWYEPDHVYHGPRVDAGLFTPPTRADVIQIETTYYLVDPENQFQPHPMCAGSSEFPFPVEGKNYNNTQLTRTIHLDHEQYGVDTMRRVRLASVSPGTSTQGTISIQREVPVGLNQSVQFLDHMFTVKGVNPSLFDPNQGSVTLRDSYLGNTFAEDGLSFTINVGQQRFCDRAMNCAYTAAKFQDELPASEFRTSYVKLTGFEAGKAVLTIGKVLKAGEIFYVDGVRMEVAAVQTEDGALSYLTIRTPLPKSDPYGTWTSVTVDSNVIDDADRENNRRVDAYNENQWQVVDSSKVTTQFLVEFDWTDPLPVNPPFNHEVYRKVDDIDVQLWECGTDPPNDEGCHGFPFGIAEDGDGLPQTTNMPPFENGQAYLTQANPPQAWIDWFDAVLTPAGEDLQNLLARSSFEDGYNWHAWNVDDDTPSQQIEDHAGIECSIGATSSAGNTCDTNFYWVKEWYEGRYTTNVQEIPQLGTGDYASYEINSHPDKYTAFVFPDVSNPVSWFDDDNDLHFSDDGDVGDEDCTRGDIFFQGLGDPIEPQTDGGDCDATFTLLGGDYLVTTSFILEDVGGGEGPHHPFDTHTGAPPNNANNAGFDCAFNVNEVFAGINIYLADPNNVNVQLVFQAINAYLSGPPVGSYHSSQQQFAQYTGCP